MQHICPHCSKPLMHWDVYGMLSAPKGLKVIGDIYKCVTENCVSKVFGNFFYDRSREEIKGSKELKEGYPP